MKKIHVPVVDTRYWAAILLASIAGTNMGDLYAHSSGLGLLQGFAALIPLTMVVFAIERLDHWPKEFYYWLVIIIIRTGATNVADFISHGWRGSAGITLVGVGLLLAVLSWVSAHRIVQDQEDDAGLPKTDALYWCGMLAAGVFGTIAGDVASHLMGQGVASILLVIALGSQLRFGHGSHGLTVGGYWSTVALARTAGTAIGDWFAEDDMLNIGLLVATLISVSLFATLLMMWRTPSKKATT